MLPAGVETREELVAFASTLGLLAWGRSGVVLAVAATARVISSGLERKPLTAKCGTLARVNESRSYGQHQGSRMSTLLTSK